MIRDVIKQDYERYQDKRADGSVDEQAVEVAEAVLAALDGDLSVALGARSHVDYMLSYIEEEQRRLGDRDEPLCTCLTASCKLKNQSLPRTVRTAESVEAGIAEFRQSHPGTPTVLLEAREEWQTLLERVRHHVSLAHAILVQGTEPAPGTVDDVDDVMPDEYPLPAGIASAEDLLS